MATFAGQVAVAVDNARLYERQRQMIAQLQELHDRLTEVERANLLSRERQRIAGALHDRLDQEIFMIGVRLSALLDSGITDPRVAEELQELRRLSADASDELRRAIFSLTGGELQGSVTDDIRSLLRDLQRRSDVQAHLSVSGTPTPAAETLHDVVRAVVNEALTNVSRHANATVVLVSLRYEADHLDVTVQDDGVGAPQFVLRTFQDSYLHFGLRHIRQMVIDRGGSFTVTNGEEAGLVVRASHPAPHPTAVIRLIIVDDHEIVREGLKTILQSEPDFEIVGESGTAEQLTQLVDETRPDVVLLDARLPGVSGAEACRRLTISHPDIAVLMISTYSDQQLVEECIKAGAKGYVVKDIERFTLKESIRALHAGGGAVSPTVAATVLDRLRGTDEIPAQPASIPLSDTQLEIVRLIAGGLSNREIADRVHLSQNTVKSHVQEIFRKLDVGNRVEAALMATRKGWI